MGVRKIGKKWYVDLYDAEGKRYVKVAGTTKEQAETVLRELERKKYFKKHGISFPELETMKVEELFKRFQFKKENEVRTRTMDDWIPYLRFWKNKHLEKSKTFVPLSRIEIEDALDELSEERDYAPKTVNGYLGAIKQVYQYAEELNLLKENPAKNIKRLKEKPRKSPRSFSKEEVHKILDNANDFYKDLFRFFLYMGMRRDEVRYLEWEDIDFKNKEIHIRNKENFSPKYGKERTVPMHPEVEKILKRRKKDSGFVFPSTKGKEFSQNIWQEQLLEITQKLNIKDAKLHTFRHTFASRAVRQMDIKSVAEILGQTDLKTTMRYIHGSRDHIRKKMRELIIE